MGAPRGLVASILAVLPRHLSTYFAVLRRVSLCVRDQAAGFALLFGCLSYARISQAEKGVEARRFSPAALPRAERSARRHSRSALVTTLLSAVIMLFEFGLPPSSRPAPCRR